jgi:hypothetical protein
MQFGMPRDGTELAWPLGANAKAGSVDPLSVRDEADEPIQWRPKGGPEKVRLLR